MQKLTFDNTRYKSRVQSLSNFNIYSEYISNLDKEIHLKMIYALSSLSKLIWLWHAISWISSKLWGQICSRKHTTNMGSVPFRIYGQTKSAKLMGYGIGVRYFIQCFCYIQMILFFVQKISVSQNINEKKNKWIKWVPCWPGQKLTLVKLKPFPPGGSSVPRGRSCSLHSCFYLSFYVIYFLFLFICLNEAPQIIIIFTIT